MSRGSKESKKSKTAVTQEGTTETKGLTLG